MNKKNKEQEINSSQTIASEILLWWLIFMIVTLLGKYFLSLTVV
jgi:hypothetical protein